MSNNKTPGRNGNHQKSSPRCRKNLFGTDHARTQSDIEVELEQLQKDECKKFQQRWNFNLNRDGSIEPTEGKYDWDGPLHVKPSLDRHSLLYIPPENQNSDLSTKIFTLNQATNSKDGYTCELPTESDSNKSDLSASENGKKREFTLKMLGK